MKEFNKVIKTTVAKEHSLNHMNGMYNYKSVDGRTYQTDKLSKVYEKRTTRLRPEYEKKKTADKTASPQNIRAVEKYLGELNLTPMKDVESVYQIKRYDENGDLIIGVSDDVFEMLKKRYPKACNYIGWTDIYMSMRNRHPLREEPLQIEKSESHEVFPMDEVKQLYNIGDIVWTYFPNPGGEVTVEKATVDSYYYKEMKNNTCDVMYGLKSPSFGLGKIVWRLQGNNSVFNNEKDALIRVEKMNHQ